MIGEGDPVQQQRRFLVEYEDMQTGGVLATSVKRLQCSREQPDCWA